MGMMNAKQFANHKVGQKVKPKTITGTTGAKQENREECDINLIVKRFSATGEKPVNMQKLQPIFADVSSVGDYAGALRAVTAANEAFAALPAELRTQFGNNPESLVSFIQDDANYDEAVRLGLIEKKPEPVALAPQKVVIVKDETAVPPITK